LSGLSGEFHGRARRRDENPVARHEAKDMQDALRIKAEPRARKHVGVFRHDRLGDAEPHPARGGEVQQRRLVAFRLEERGDHDIRVEHDTDHATGAFGFLERARLAAAISASISRIVSLSVPFSRASSLRSRTASAKVGGAGRVDSSQRRSASRTSSLIVRFSFLAMRSAVLSWAGGRETDIVFVVLMVVLGVTG
jgi:hypothetical protein